MPSNKIEIPAQYIVPLNMNGLKGRMLRMPPPAGSEREALVIYGHHSSLERLFSFAKVINDDIGITMPDLPGFGGMDSLYAIGEKPDLNTMADYIASIVKLRYKKNQRFSILGVSYGFIAITRMLERYPDIAARVDMLISVVGFTHKDEFTFSRTRYRLYLMGSSLFTHRITAALFRNTVLQPVILRNFYSRTHNAKHKFKNLNEEDRKFLTEYEIHLWRLNDIRTHWATTVSFLKVNNCMGKVKLPVWHIHTKSDIYFNNDLVEKNMGLIFTKVNSIVIPLDGHMPNVIAGKEETAVLIPEKIHKLLRKKLKS